MKYCRINLLNTNYIELDTAVLMTDSDRRKKMEYLQSIYKTYCRYKNFTSVMPLFPSIILDTNTDVFGYYNKSTLVAFSLVKKHDNKNVESLQFAWTYSEPNLKLGIKSLEHECAYYKKLGYKFLYLGKVADYKSKFNGYEQLGNLYV